MCRPDAPKTDRVLLQASGVWNGSLHLLKSGTGTCRSQPAPMHAIFSLYCLSVMAVVWTVGDLQD